MMRLLFVALIALHLAMPVQQAKLQLVVYWNDPTSVQIAWDGPSNPCLWRISQYSLLGKKLTCGHQPTKIILPAKAGDRFRVTDNDEWITVDPGPPPLF